MISPPPPPIVVAQPSTRIEKITFPVLERPVQRVSARAYSPSATLRLDVFVDGHLSMSYEQPTDCTIFYYLRGVAVRITDCGPGRQRVRIRAVSSSPDRRRVTVRIIG